MHSRLLLRLLVPFALVAFALLLLPLTARADEEEDVVIGSEQRPLRIKVRKVHKTSGEAPKPRNPMDSVHRWLMREMPKMHETKGGKSSPLHAWFDGGADVPLASLRDVLKADGWTADQLVAWIHKHAAHAAQAPQASSPHMFGQAHPRSSPWGQAPQRRDMMRGFRMRRPHAFARRGRMFGGRPPFMGGAPWGNAWYGRGHAGGGSTGPMWGGMYGGPVQQQSRTIILWNDGSGWQRQEIPGPGGAGGGSGRGAGPWMGGMGPSGPGPMGRPGRGGPPQPPQPHDMAQVLEWLQQMKEKSEGPAKVAPQGPGTDPKVWMEFLRRMRQRDADGPPDWAGMLRKLYSGAEPKVHVKELKLKRPAVGIIEAEIEEEVEAPPKK